MTMRSSKRLSLLPTVSLKTEFELLAKKFQDIVAEKSTVRRIASGRKYGTAAMAIVNVLRQTSQRWRCQVLATLLLNFFCIGLATAFVYRVLLTSAWLLLPATCLILSALWRFLNQYPRLADIAFILDRHWHLAERLTSSYWLLRFPDDSSLGQVIIEDSALCLTNFARAPLPKPQLPLTIAIITAVLLACFLSVWPITASSLSPANPGDTAKKNAITAMRRAIAILTQAREQNLAHRLAKLAEKWQRDKTTAKQVGGELMAMIATVDNPDPQTRLTAQQLLRTRLASLTGKSSEHRQDPQQLAAEISRLSEQQRGQLALYLRRQSVRPDNALTKIADNIRRGNEKQLAEQLTPLADGRQTAASQQARQVMVRVVRSLAGKGSSALPGSASGNADAPTASTATGSDFLAIENKIPDIATFFAPAAESTTQAPSPQAYLKKPWWPRRYSAVITDYFINLDKE